MSSLIGLLLLLYFYPIQSVGFLLSLLVLAYLLIVDRQLSFFILR